MASAWGARHEEGRSAVIPEEAVSRVLASTDIVQLIGGYLPLKPAGRYHKALCPFHAEKTPSFIVNPERQIFHCFGCGEGGDAIGFLMKQERFTFPEAIRSLADRAGITLPARFGGTAGGGSGRQEEGRLALLEIHKAATEYFRQQLAHQTDGVAARDYLRTRGVPDPVVEQFLLGFAPASWEGLLRRLLRQGFDKEQVQRAGLALARKEGSGAYDRFRHRLMIPICDSAGKVIAFGGRALDGSEPKYLNSPETPIYKKGAHLFGLHLAASAIRERASVLVVEGYFDLIALHAQGFRHAVAVLGTALTGEQIALLRRYTTQAFLIFDPDAAGIAAARRSAEALLNSGLDWRVVLLPEGKDPDRLLREHDSSAFTAALDHAKDLMEFLLDRRVTQFNLSSPEGQAAATKEVLPLLAAIENEITRQRCVETLARRVALPTEVIVRELNFLMRGSRRDPIPPALQPKSLPSIEWRVMHLALHDPEAARLVREELWPQDIEDPVLRRVFQHAVLQSGGARGRAAFEAAPGRPLAMEEPEMQRVLSELLATDLHEYDGRDAIDRTLSDCLTRIAARRERRASEQLQRRMEEAEHAGDHTTVERLQAEFLALRKDPTSRGIQASS